MELERACRGDGELQDGKNEFYGANLIVLQDGLKSIIIWSLRKLCKRRVTSDDTTSVVAEGGFGSRGRRCYHL
jgi:hypothetical protein